MYCKSTVCTVEFVKRSQAEPKWWLSQAAAPTCNRPPALCPTLSCPALPCLCLADWGSSALSAAVAQLLLQVQVQAQVRGVS
jgi:hypothetical protein